MNYAKARVSPKRSVALVVYQVPFLLVLGSTDEKVLES